jgi:hypothetical protein
MNTEKIKNIMKKPLNEEINRIKSIMGCCKGKLNEDQENCVDPESPEGQEAIDKAVGYIKYEIDTNWGLPMRTLPLKPKRHQKFLMQKIN